MVSVHSGIKEEKGSHSYWREQSILKTLGKMFSILAILLDQSTAAKRGLWKVIQGREGKAPTRKAFYEMPKSLDSNL